jgi:hypothetical protein
MAAGRRTATRSRPGGQGRQPPQTPVSEPAIPGIRHGTIRHGTWPLRPSQGSRSQMACLEPWLA